MEVPAGFNSGGLKNTKKTTVILDDETRWCNNRDETEPAEQTFSFVPPISRTQKFHSSSLPTETPLLPSPSRLLPVPAAEDALNKSAENCSIARLMQCGRKDRLACPRIKHTLAWKCPNEVNPPSEESSRRRRGRKEEETEKTSHVVTGCVSIKAAKLIWETRWFALERIKSAPCNAKVGTPHPVNGFLLVCFREGYMCKTSSCKLSSTSCFCIMHWVCLG